MTEQQAPQEEKDVHVDLERVPISGRFERYRSSYWSGAIAALGLRYWSRLFERSRWNEPENLTSFEKNKYSMMAGTIMHGVAGLYARGNWKDMKTIFSESLAWEFDKKPEDVGVADFLRSSNTVVKQTVNNYIHYNLRRFAVNSTFFLPYVLSPFLKNKKWFQELHPESGADIGVGANAAYLFWDIKTRKVTPFEELQTLIDRKINHVDSFSDKITAEDLLNIYERHAVNDDNKTFMHHQGTLKWNESMQLFERIADLINQSYKNEIPREKADFGFSKFIYMVGMQMLDPFHIDRSRLLVEIANSTDVKAAGQALREIKQGADLAAVAEKYHAALPEKLPEAEVAQSATPVYKSILADKQPDVSVLAREQAKRMKSEPHQRIA